RHHPARVPGRAAPLPAPGARPGGRSRDRRSPAPPAAGRTAAGAYRHRRLGRRRHPRRREGVGTMNFLDLFDQDLFSSVLRSLIPILLAALGGMLAERVGIFNIGLEGMILVGAFSGVAASFFTHNWIVGVVVAMISGALFSLILGYGSVYRKGDPI